MSDSSVNIDSISLELAEQRAADPNLSETALANMELNMRRLSQESASPTVKDGQLNGKLKHNSFSLSSQLIQTRDDECSMSMHTPTHVSGSPAPFEPLSPTSSANGSAPNLGVRRPSLHVPAFSVSDSSLHLLSPSHVSSGWEPPSTARGDGPKVTPTTATVTSITTIAAQPQPQPQPLPQTSPQPASPSSPLASPKKKSTAIWKFWKKKKDDTEKKKDEKDGKKTDLKASLADVDSTGTAPTIDITVGAPVRTTSNSSTKTVIRSDYNSLTPPMNSLGSPKGKNKLSPRGGSTGREGGHKRQKSSIGADVHTARVEDTPNKTKSPASTVTTVPPVSAAVVNTGDKKKDDKESKKTDTAPTTSSSSKPSSTSYKSGSSTHRSSAPDARASDSSGSKTSRSSRKSAKPELDPLLASLIYSGLLGEGATSYDLEPESPEPQNSYVDSVYEVPGVTPPRSFPKPAVRPMVSSSWTRTVFSPHVIPNPNREKDRSSGPTSGISSPSIRPSSPRGSFTNPRPSMIVYASPTFVSGLSNPSSPSLSPLLLPPSSVAPSSLIPSELRQLISGHSFGFLLFLRHLQREYASESLLFWKAAEDFLPLAAKEVQDLSEHEQKSTKPSHLNLGFSRIYLSIYNRYLKAGASHEINISSSLRDLLRKDAEAHEQIRQAWIASAQEREANARRDSQTLNQASLSNLSKIEQVSDDESIAGATLVNNPLHSNGPSSSSTDNKTTHVASPPTILAGLDGMKLTEPTSSTTSCSSSLAISTYTHLLQSQVEIEKLLTQDCLPRFKHSPGWQKWRKYLEQQELEDNDNEEMSSSSASASNASSKISSPILISTAADKRGSCILPTSSASSFTIGSSATSSLSTSPTDLSPVLGVASKRSSMCIDPNFLPSSVTPSLGIGGSSGSPSPLTPAVPISVGVSNSVIPRHLTVGATVFAEAAAAARGINNHARARATTQIATTSVVHQ